MSKLGAERAGATAGIEDPSRINQAGKIEKLTGKQAAKTAHLQLVAVTACSREGGGRLGHAIYTVLRWTC